MAGSQHFQKIAQKYAGKKKEVCVKPTAQLPVAFKQRRPHSGLSPSFNFKHDTYKPNPVHALLRQASPPDSDPVADDLTASLF